MTVALRPVVAESVTVFSVPVVTPTVLLVVEVAVLMPRLMTPGLAGEAWAGALVCVAIGVVLVPSGFVDFGVGVVVFCAGVDVGLILEAGVAMFLILGPLDVWLGVGRVFFVPIGVRVVGLEALSTVVFAAIVVGFLTGVVVEALLVSAGVFEAGVVVVVDFFTAVGALFSIGAVVFFTGVGLVAGSTALVVVDFTGVVRVSFAGALRTGVVLFVAVDVVFFFAATGVPAVFAGVVAGFFAVCCAPWATLEMLPTPA